MARRLRQARMGQRLRTVPAVRLLIKVALLLRKRRTPPRPCMPVRRLRRDRLAPIVHHLKPQRRRRRLLQLPWAVQCRLKADDKDQCPTMAAREDMVVWTLTRTHMPPANTAHPSSQNTTLPPTQMSTTHIPTNLRHSSSSSSSSNAHPRSNSRRLLNSKRSPTSPVLLLRSLPPTWRPPERAKEQSLALESPHYHWQRIQEPASALAWTTSISWLCWERVTLERSCWLKPRSRADCMPSRS